MTIPPLARRADVIAERLLEVHRRLSPDANTRRHDALAIIGALKVAGWDIVRSRRPPKEAS